MTWHRDMRAFAKRAEFIDDIYSRIQPAMPEGNVSRLTPTERRQVERHSTERGYRRLRAEGVGRI
jgi:uncharacterized membrane protein